MSHPADFWEYSDSEDFSEECRPPEPDVEADDFLRDLGAFVAEEDPSTLRLNRPRGRYFLAPDRWLAVSVPDGLRHALWNVHPHFTELRREADRAGLAGVPIKDTEAHVRSMLALLEKHGDGLKRAPDGSIVHRATVFHPRTMKREETDVLLVELPMPGDFAGLLEDPAQRFGGLFEVRAARSGRPLMYGKQELRVPPGFPSHQELLETSGVVLD